MLAAYSLHGEKHNEIKSTAWAFWLLHLCTYGLRLHGKKAEKRRAKKNRPVKITFLHHLVNHWYGLWSVLMLANYEERGKKYVIWSTWLVTFGIDWNVGCEIFCCWLFRNSTKHISNSCTMWPNKTFFFILSCHSDDNTLKSCILYIN